MGVAKGICQKITTLTAAQIEHLDYIADSLELAADLAHAQATIYAKARSEGFLVIVAQARPNTTFVHRKTSLLGTTVHMSEEPLISRTLDEGDCISGQREWALGMLLAMRTYPVYDSSGKIIAAVSFESSSEEVNGEGYAILMETANMLLASAPVIEDRQHVLRPLSTSDGIIIVDSAGQVLFANAAAASIYKIWGAGSIIGRHIYEREVNMRLAQQALKICKPCEDEVEAGNMILVQRAIPICDGHQAERVALIVADVTEIKKKEKELLIKSAVIQEIHHRVKNNLQTIASLLRLQSRRTKSQEVKAALRESVNRILSISVVHEFLSQQDAEFIDVAEVAKNILDMVIQNMLEPDFNLQTVFNGHTVILPSEKASSLALVINELIQNSIEHGFVGRHEGVVGVDIETLSDCYKVEIYDNGIGIPPDFTPQSSSSLGLQIVRTLIESDLGGTFKLYGNNGTHASITIPRYEEVDK
jgi:two-component sensor histidine kinase